MVTKKNIFEKLGLIESVTEEDELEEVLSEDIEKSGDIRDKKISDEKDVNDTEIKKLDEKILKKEVEIDESQKIIESENIEEKLDELIGSYEQNKLLTIEDIYRNARLTLDPKKSIFMVDILTKTLPENLPIDMKRETVISLMDVSELKKDNLLNDAYKRIDSLNTIMEDTVDKSDEIISKNDNTIRELEKRIADLDRINDERVEFQNNQNKLVEYEIQKIIGIVDFVKPKK